MKTITRDEFSPSSVVDELLDGAGVIMLKDVFSPERIKRIAQTLEAETDEAIDTGSHFNQNDQDPLLQRRVWFTRLVELDPDIASLVEEPMIFQSMQAFLGKEFVMGSMCASGSCLAMEDKSHTSITPTGIFIVAKPSRPAPTPLFH